ncbi:hypothetical protein [Falsiroseomonas sp.]|uniref:hypothetical protein n=1 Tax=Falsiroseomonas sp. TaxID=2870721 RepID=UPI003569F7A5
MKARHGGTTEMIYWCIQRNESRARIIGIDARTLCTNRYSLVIATHLLSARGAFECYSQVVETRTFSGTINNVSQNIITTISVAVSFKEDPRLIISETANVWLPPGQNRFSVTFTDPIKCSDVRASASGEWPYNWEWFVMTGVSVAVK